MATFTGIGGAFGSYFGSKDLADAYDEAMAEYRLYKTQVENSLSGYRTKGGEVYDRFKTGLTNPEMAPDIAQLRSFLTTSLQTGLSPAAQLYMKDASRLLENRLSATGNLRSGAATLQNAQLGERVVASEWQRALQAFDTFRKGDIAAESILGNVALGYGQLEDIALGHLGTAVSGIAGAKVGQGAAQYAGSVALGQGIGGLFDKGEEYAKMYFTGGASNLMSQPNNLMSQPKDDVEA